MEKLTRNSNVHDLSEMGWEVKQILRGQSKHGLWGSNVKTIKFLLQGLSGLNLFAIFCNLQFFAPFSELCLPCGSLVGDLNKHHLTLTSWVHRFRIYKLFFYVEYYSRGGGTGEKFNLPNTCPKWTGWGAFEWHWPTDHEYITFLAVGTLGAEI